MACIYDGSFNCSYNLTTFNEVFHELARRDFWPAMENRYPEIPHLEDVHTPKSGQFLFHFKY